MKKAQRIRLGVFLMVGSLLLLLMVALFTARRLFEQKDFYYVAFQDISVSGLESGSPVKYLGINVGSISEIFIDPERVNTIIVRIALRQGTPVKTDAVADIVAMGITGLKTIEIRGGSQDAPLLKENGFIQAGTSFTEDITGKAEVIILKVEQVLNNLQDFTHPDRMQLFSETVDNISKLVVNTDQTVEVMRALLTENRSGIQQSVASVNRITGSLEETSQELGLAIGRFNEIMQGDTLSEVLGNLREVSVTLRETDLNKLIESLANTIFQTQELLYSIGQDVGMGSETLNENLLLLQQALKNLNDASRKISTDPSVLIRGQRSRGTPDDLVR